MRQVRFALAAAVIGVLALSAPGAVPTPPATATASAPASASAPATAIAPATMTAQELAARKALIDFFHAMFVGDQAALGMLVYSELDEKKLPKNQALAETSFGELLAEQRLRIAAHAAFGDAADTAFNARGVIDLGKGKAEVAAFEKDLGNATVRLETVVKTATAPADGITMTGHIQMGAGPAFVVVLKGGAGGEKWMVDFDRTQSNIGPLPTALRISVLAKQMAGYNQLAKDIAAKKFGSVQEIIKQVDQIDADADVKGAESQPATATRP